MNWFDNSYMVKRGVAAGKTGKTHELTQAVQGKYHYVYGPYADPVLHINPGAAGQQGFHKVKTIVRFTLDNNEIKDLEVVEFD